MPRGTNMLGRRSRKTSVVVIAATAITLAMSFAASASTVTKNWAGYAAGSGTYPSVSASWNQPAATCGSADTGASFWVGLDGFTSETVEQIGTRASCVGGRPQYESWVEIYPLSKGATTLSVPVRPGDRITASITANNGNVTFTLSNLTIGRSTTTKARVKAAFSSAEIIAEESYRSTGGQLQQLPLTNFGRVQFTSVSVNGQPISRFSPTQLDIGQNGVMKTLTSALSPAGDFSVDWLAS